MTTNALMELADRLDTAASATTDWSSNPVKKILMPLYDADHQNLLREAATQLRTAAAEGGEAVGKLVRPHPPGAGVIPRTTTPTGATQIVPNENALRLPPGEYPLYLHLPAGSVSVESVPIPVNRLPPPDAVDYPDSGFRTDAGALAIWAAHMYDTGGTPYWGADAMHSHAHRQKATDSGAGRDGERYRWLRDHCAGTLQVYAGTEELSLLPDELDAAIDTAIAGAAGEKDRG